MTADALGAPAHVPDGWDEDARKAIRHVVRLAQASEDAEARAQAAESEAARLRAELRRAHDEIALLRAQARGVERECAA